LEAITIPREVLSPVLPFRSSPIKQQICELLHSLICRVKPAARRCRIAYGLEGMLNFLIFIFQSRNNVESFSLQHIISDSLFCRWLTAMTVQDYLLKFRKVNSLETLEKLFDHLNYSLTDDSDIIKMYRAADHRRAELASGGRLFDLGCVPKTVWHYVV